jgi:transposase
MRAPLRVTRLRGRQAARLRSLYRTTDCPRTRLRAQMIWLSSEGYSVAEIADISQQSDDTVRRWLQRFLDQGWRGLLEAPRSGRPAAISPAVEQFLAECLQGSPRDFRIARPTWTTALLAQVVRRRLKIAVTAECIRQHLAQVEGVCRRPTWTVKYRAQAQPGYAHTCPGGRCQGKKAGSQGCCSTRRAGPMSTFKMKLSSACSRPSRACGLAEGRARSTAQDPRAWRATAQTT